MSKFRIDKFVPLMPQSIESTAPNPKGRPEKLTSDICQSNGFFSALEDGKVIICLACLIIIYLLVLNNSPALGGLMLLKKRL